MGRLGLFIKLDLFCLFLGWWYIFLLVMRSTSDKGNLNLEV